MNRRSRLSLSGLIFFSWMCLLKIPSQAAILDVGTDYRLRGLSYSKVDYGVSSGQDYSYYSQRALAHIGGRFSPNIEFMTQVQAIGVAGSSASVTNPTVDPGMGRYPNTNFTPWVQWAYMKATQLYDMPIDLTVGRQPILLGDGLILSDDDLGFTGIRAQTRLPWYGLRADLFTFKTGDALQGARDADIYGIEFTKPLRAVRYQASWVMERDRSGNTLYIRPSENTSSALLSGSDFRATSITRQFYDARIEGRLLQGGFYKFEGVLQTGHVDRSSATLGSVDIGGYAFLVSGGLFTRFSKYGPIEIHGTFGLASGDSGGGKDNSFRPSFGHRFDGLERSGFGEYYGASLYDALPTTTYGPTGSTAAVSGLPPGYSGMRVIGAGVTTHPTNLLSIGIDYYVYTAQETPGSNFPVGSSESSLGTELDIGAGFAYTSYLTFRASYAMFSPGKAYPNRDQATRLLIEAIGRF